MTALPQGWTETALGDVCELLNGRAYSQHELLSEGKYPVLRVGNLFSRNAWYHSDLELDPDKFIDSGDLIYAWSASFGPRIWQGGKVIYHYHIWKCALQDQAVDKHFLYNLLLWDTAKIKGDHGVGSTMMHVTKSAMEKRQIPLPPLPEQRRIVRKLDTLSARSTTTRTHLTAIEKLVERYRQAVIDAAFSTFELTVPLLELVDQETGIPYGLVQTGEPFEGGVPTVRAGDIKDFRLLEAGLKQVDPAVASQYARTKLKGGEVLIAIRGSVGETCVVPSSMRGNNISREVALVPVAPDVDAAFIMYFLRSVQAAQYIKANIKGVAQTGINLRDLKNLPCPDLVQVEQREIVRRIETAFAKIDRLKAEAAKALKLLGHLDQRILAKAFAGDLVPQDPTDEPAETLLARIRDTRAVAPKARRGRKAKA